MKKTCRRLFSLLISLMLVFSMVTAAGAAVQLGDCDFRFANLSGGIMITKYTSNYTEIIIPEAIVGVPVTQISDQAFFGCNLVSVEIPVAVSTIGDRAFSTCSSLESFSVDARNANYCAVDGVLFSKDMTTLVRVPNQYGKSTFVVPDSVTTIGSNAFADARGLTTITIPEGIILE